jgi:hypothetical protein
MRLSSFLPTRLFGRKSRRASRKTAVASRSGKLRSLLLEPLEHRMLLSVNIPIYNGGFESPTVWVSNYSYNGVVQQTVQPGPQGSWAADGQDQPANTNILDPRFGTPGWGKTAQGGGGPGENTEGIYSELNDTGSNQNVYYNLVNGQLPAPASGTNCLNIIPAPGGVYNIWIDQQTDSGSQNPGDSLSHYSLNYPGMIAATAAIAGHTYQVTAALGNPLVNGSAGIGASVEMDFTIAAGTYYEPSGTNSYNYATGQTNAPQSGDTSLFYNGYGTTVASITTDSTWNNLAAGSFRAQTLQWTCPAQDAGLPLDVMFIFRCGTEQVSLDNVQLVDLTASSIIPTAPTALSAAPVSSNQVNLSWTDTAGDETGFQIDRSTNSSFTQNLTSFTTTGTTTSYSDTSAAPGTTYYYRVWATNGGNLSTSPTNTATATTGPGAYSVPNYSFENPALANGGYSNNNITSWTIGTTTTNYTAGVQNNTGASYFSSVPNGSQFAFLNADSNNSGYNASDTLTSTVLGTVSGGESYTLTADIGNRLDVPYANNGTYTISLLDGGTVLASQAYSGSSIAPGAWYDLNLGFTTPANVATGNLQIQLGFATAGYTSGNVFGQGDFDDIGLTAGTVSAPAAPSGLTATAASASQINLAWTNNANNQTGFQIDQATNSGFTQNLTTATVAANATSYSATGLSASTTYYYRVRAINSAGDSANSNTASATTLVNSSTPISVPNYSFENPAQANGGYSNNNVTSWTISVASGNYTSGVQNNTSASYFSSVPDGVQFAFINTDSNSSYYQSSDALTSAVLGTVAGGQTYTLTVAVGNRLDVPYANNGTYTISLLDGGTVLSSQTYSGSSIAPGAWYNLALAYTTPVNVATGNLQVQLGFATAGYTSGNVFGQGDFDNVGLTSIAVANPSFSIPNYSFENPAQANGGYTNNSATTWTIGTTPGNYSAGVQNNTSASYFSSVPNGAQFAYVNADSNSSYYNSSNTLTSAVLGTVSGGQTYTLTVAIGNRLDFAYADNGTYTISLLDGGTVLSSQSYAGSSIAAGAWYNLTLVYTTPGNVAPGNLQIQLGFSTAGYTSGNVFGQGDFDNVSLTTT